MEQVEGPGPRALDLAQSWGIGRRNGQLVNLVLGESLELSRDALFKALDLEPALSTRN